MENRRKVTKTEQFYLNERAASLIRNEDYIKVQNDMLRICFEMFLGQQVNYDDVYVAVSKALTVAFAEKEAEQNEENS